MGGNIMGAMVLTFVVAMVYGGLLDLALELLDPFGNNNPSDSIPDKHSSVFLDLSALLQESAQDAEKWIAAGIAAKRNIPAGRN